MKTILFALAVGLVVFTGCYNREARVEERMTVLREEWVAAHPGETLTPEIDAQLRTKAIAEEKAQRSAEVSQAKKDIVTAGGKAAAGDYIGAAVLAGGALLVLLGLKRGVAATPAPAPEPAPAPPGGNT